MKRELTLACLGLVLTATQIEAKPSSDSLPRGVRETMPAGVTSLKLVQLRLGPKKSPVLVHIWMAARRDLEYHGEKPNPNRKPITRTELSGDLTLRLSPICADIFLPTGKPKAWRLVNTLIWSDYRAPNEVQARWLQPKLKRGPVLLIGTTNMRGAHWTVIAFPDGVQGDPYRQTFTGSGSSGATGWHRFDGTDKRGFLKIDYIFSGDGRTSHTAYYWNGRGFAPGKTSRTVFKHSTYRW